jgi:hypothetical protein
MSAHEWFQGFERYLLSGEASEPLQPLRHGERSDAIHLAASRILAEHPSITVGWMASLRSP